MSSLLNIISTNALLFAIIILSIICISIAVYYILSLNSDKEVKGSVLNDLPKKNAPIALDNHKTTEVEIKRVIAKQASLNDYAQVSGTRSVPSTTKRRTDSKIHTLPAKNNLDKSEKEKREEIACYVSKTTAEITEQTKRINSIELLINQHMSLATKEVSNALINARRILKATVERVNLLYAEEQTAKKPQEIEQCYALLFSPISITKDAVNYLIGEGDLPLINPIHWAEEINYYLNKLESQIQFDAQRIKSNS
jgi:hypothetical protein